MSFCSVGKNISKQLKKNAISQQKINIFQKPREGILLEPAQNWSWSVVTKSRHIKRVKFTKIQCMDFTRICPANAISTPFSVSSIINWTRNFCHLANIKVKPKIAEIEGPIRGHYGPPTRAATFYWLFLVFLSGKWGNFQ